MTSRLSLIGHRGARGLAPENTLPSFEAAFALGVDAIEFDVGMTRDDVVVALHNPDLAPFLTRDAQGQWLNDPAPDVRQLMVDELAAYDVGRVNTDSAYGRQFPEQQAVDGTRIPRLSAVLAAFQQPGREQVGVCVELKIAPHEPQRYAEPEAFCRAVLGELQAANVLTRSSITSFDWRVLAIMQRLSPGLPMAYLSSQTYRPDPSRLNREQLLAWTNGMDPQDFGGSVPHMIHAAGGHIWSCDHRDVTPEAVATAHGLGLRVWAWTANQPEDMNRLIDAGVDGIISDYPNRLRTVAEARGLALPAAAPSV
jgi:glycerophosphoryl diester phosphodiesterase